MANDTEKNLYLSDAQFYDLDNRKIVKVDIPFYMDYTAAVTGPILELACGTGRLTIPMAEAGHEMWGLEYSETMLQQFERKRSQLPAPVANRIHLIHGDMSQFELNKEFPLILLPNRSFQLLLEEKLERSCLQVIHRHLAAEGTFIIDIGNFIPNKEAEKNWLNMEEHFDWENHDPKTGCLVRRSHIRKEIDVEKQIIYPQKIYRVTKPDGNLETITKRAPWKYFSATQIRNLLLSSQFEIYKEMGSYEGDPISETGPEFLFFCRKKA